ncbi:MAG TPA: hypothetical protein VN381_17260 [Anaerovoracaceae bacterium]|nr:hypothetical protein [Anaerovoracaceae bacterium]
MKRETGQHNHYIEDLEEWQENQYNPGYYLGGKIPGNLLYSGRPRMIGALLVGIGVMTLIPFALGIIDSFRNDVPRTPIEYVLLFVQMLVFGGFSILLIVNGIKKIIGKTR